LAIQVPIAIVVDSITGLAPHLLDYVGAAAVLVGFAGINIRSDACSGSNYEATIGDEQHQEITVAGENSELPIDRLSCDVSQIRMITSLQKFILMQGICPVSIYNIKSQNEKKLALYFKSLYFPQAPKSRDLHCNTFIQVGKMAIV
jgi:hypothetical protein